MLSQSRRSPLAIAQRGPVCSACGCCIGGTLAIVVIPAREHAHATRVGRVNEPVLLVYPARPGAGELVLQRLGLTRTLERGLRRFLDEFQRTKCQLPVVLDEPDEVLDRIRIELDGPHFTSSLETPSRFNASSNGMPCSRFSD